MTEALNKHYGHLFEEELLNEITEVAIYKEVAEGEKLIEIGSYVRSMPLLISGAIKVFREDENGDELLLYFIEAGETCATTLSCCLRNKKSEIRAIAEVDTKLIMIPIQKMDVWMSQYKSWQNFVLDSYQNRLTEMLSTIDKIAFLKMDERLLHYLQEKLKVGKAAYINNTHQEIADELNTSRVVISRLLKKMENNGLIELQRNRIRIIDLEKSI